MQSVQRHFFSLRIAILVIVAGIAVAAIDIAARGFVVVHDPAGRLVGAQLEGGGRAAPLREFARGYWAARPRADAQIVLLCRTGDRIERGDAPPGARTTYTVAPQDCRPPR